MSQKFGTRRTKNKEETRRIIFDTAYALLEEKGFAKFTMRELASRAGVGLGTIFQHFKDKSTLLVSIFTNEFQPVIDKALESVPKKDIKKQLLYLVRQFYSYYAKRPDISRILYEELFININNNETVSASYQRDIAKIAGLFASAIERKEIAPETNIFDAVMLWWSYYAVVLFMALQAPVFNVDEQVNNYKKLMEQHFQGIENKTK